MGDDHDVGAAAPEVRARAAGCGRAPHGRCGHRGAACHPVGHGPEVVGQRAGLAQTDQSVTTRRGSRWPNVLSSDNLGAADRGDVEDEGEPDRPCGPASAPGREGIGLPPGRPGGLLDDGLARATERSRVNSSRTRRRPASPIARARGGSPNTSSNASASASGSSRGTTRPVTPSSIISGTPPTAVHDRRQRGAHRLEHRHREALDGLAAEREHVEHPSSRATSPRWPSEQHPLGDAELVHQGLEARALAAVPDQQQLRVACARRPPAGRPAAAWRGPSPGA